MKSLQVLLLNQSPEETARYSDIQVLKSNAGWYLGTVYSAVEGWKEPGSRDTDYYATEERAKESLAILENCGKQFPNDLEAAIDAWENQVIGGILDSRAVVG